MFFDDKGCKEKRGNMTIILIENPKNVFSSNESVSIVEQIRNVAANGFGVDPESQSIQGIRDHIVDVDALSVCYINENILGFGSVKFRKDLDMVFLHGIVVLMSQQGKGIGSMILEPILRFRKYKRIAFTTQNPAMYGLAIKLCSTVYPSLVNRDIPINIMEIARAMMEKRKGIFCDRTFVSKNLFSKCLYNQIPVVKDPKINNWFRESLSIKNGISRDGMLVLGDLKS